MPDPAPASDFAAPHGIADAGLLLAQFAEIAPGRVRTWFSADVVNTLSALEAGPERDAAAPLLAVCWPPGADINRAVEHIIASLARVSLARWPNWYGEQAPFDQPGLGASMMPEYDDRVIKRLGETHPALDAAWTRRAVLQCRRGTGPLLPGIAHPIQLKQLLMTLAETDPILLLVLNAVDVDGPARLGFARTAAWVASESRARVAAFVPSAFREAPEFDAISYGATHVEVLKEDAVGRGGGRDSTGEAPGPLSNGGAHVNLPQRDGTPRSPARRANDEPLRLVIPPIVGQPHPSSPGEQLLAARLARDAELAPLFSFNQRVETSSGESFVVDLLWREGKMTVEVDGYAWHSGPHAFAADRHRDYRLLCDGYRTLRLPHDEVMDDPALQCEKIRDVVRAIRKEI